jgi:hypothetical protein
MFVVTLCAQQTLECVCLLYNYAHSRYWMSCLRNRAQAAYRVASVLHTTAPGKQHHLRLARSGGVSL